jgi:uncharacterized Ntn-hydrolase superfamily protein
LSTHPGTFSIVAADPEAGEVGCAVQSKYFSVGSVVPWARAGVGAVATQAAGVAVYGRRALDELERGTPPAAAVAHVLADDEGRETRQLGAVTADGRAAAFTGADCLDWAGHRTGPGYAVQGNILAGEDVVAGMARAFEETAGSPLFERLVAALEAGQAAGGDRRGQQSAAVVVERSGAHAESREGVDRVCDLRVEDHPEPIVELRRLVGIWMGWEAQRRAQAAYERGEPAAAADTRGGCRRSQRGRRPPLQPRVLRGARGPGRRRGRARPSRARARAVAAGARGERPGSRLDSRPARSGLAAFGHLARPGSDRHASGTEPAQTCADSPRTVVSDGNERRGTCESSSCCSPSPPRSASRAWPRRRAASAVTAT